LIGVKSFSGVGARLSVASANYYRKQAETCLQMSRVCSDPILAERLGVLAAAFREAAADISGDARAEAAVTDFALPSGANKRH